MKVKGKINGRKYNFEIEDAHRSIRHNLDFVKSSNNTYHKLIIEILYNVKSSKFQNRCELIKESKEWESIIRENYSSIINRNWNFQEDPIIRTMSKINNIYIEALRLPPFWTRDYSIRLYFTYNPKQNEVIYLVGQKKSWSELDTSQYIVQAVEEAKKYFREKGWL